MDQRIIPLDVKNEYILGAGVVVGAAGSHDEVLLELDFRDSPAWVGTTKKAIFHNALGEDGMTVILTTGYLAQGQTEVYLVPVPAKAKAIAGECSLSLEGVVIEGAKEVIRITTEEAFFRVLPNSRVTGEEDVTPTLAEQLQGEIDDIKGKIDGTEANAQAAAKSAAAAEGYAKIAAGATVSVWQSNPNLLDNWYFGNPVNQRGQTSLTGGYGIDRWKQYAERSLACSLTEDGIQLVNDGSTTQGHQQNFEAARIIAGQTYTLSALLRIVSDETTGPNTNVALSYGLNASDNTGTRWVTRAEAPIGEWVCIAYTFKPKESTTGVMNVRTRLSSYGPTVIDLKAMKLELGDTQTLAHQDADGNWVLNEIPSYADQLARCQRYLQVFEAPYDTAANYFTTGVAYNSEDFWVQIPLAVPMRTSPTVSINDAGLLKVGKSYSSVVSATKVTGGWAIKSGDDCVMRSAIISASGLTAGENYNLFMANGAKLTLSAEL